MIKRQHKYGFECEDYFNGRECDKSHHHEPATNSQLKAHLSTNEVRQLVDWFCESYDKGWRPGIHAPSYWKKFRNKISEAID